MPSRDDAADPGAAPHPARNHRILFDCTETAGSAAATGIQRVVRGIVGAALAGASPGIECVAVAYDGARFVALSGLPPDLRGERRRADSALRERARILATRGYRSPVLRNTVLHPQVLSVVRQSVSYLRWKRLRPTRGRHTGIRYRGGDWLVLLDSTWGPDLSEELRRAKRSGTRVCVVVYDLIQIHHAHLVSPGAGAIYRRWFARTIPLADRIMAISRSVRDELLGYLQDRPDLAPRGTCVVDWFHLGSDIGRVTGREHPGPEASKLFGPGHAPTFLVVGTLEQRKEQSRVLDAFEARWAAGDPARLVLVGREGWGSHALTGRIDRHPERGRRLVWLAHASDADLELCYRHASALIMASSHEGFGLPIAESLARGVPVIAADIPVFREVGGDAVTYVAPRDTAALAAAIAGARREVVDRESYRLPLRSWNDATQTLISRLLQAGTGN
jgi:glycosyltransferase involved in cell wall biosynthesis